MGGRVWGGGRAEGFENRARMGMVYDTNGEEEGIDRAFVAEACRTTRHRIHPEHLQQNNADHYNIRGLSWFCDVLTTKRQGHIQKSRLKIGNQLFPARRTS